MRKSTQKLLSGISAAVMSLTAVSAANVAVMGSAISAFAANYVLNEWYESLTLPDLDIDVQGGDNCIDIT